MTRYDFDPLERLVLAQVGPRLTSHGQHAGKGRLLAEELGTSPRQIYRWRQIGVTADQADELAVRVGFVPYEVWPEMVTDPTINCDECAAGFVPPRKDSRFCSRLCNRRWWRKEMIRRRRKRNPAVVERERLARRAYYAENAEYEKARERRRYHQKRTNESMVA